MQTKLSKLCGGTIEASWLGALIIIPLFFNVYSSRIFEPDKAALLRICVLLGIAAWIIKVIDEIANQEQKITFDQLKIGLFTQLRRPIILVVAIIVLVYFLSTLLSITPLTSLWGSYQRSQGFYTFLSYIILFFLVANNLKTTAQVDRIVTMTILTSLPVAFYGVIQHYGLDPVPWAGNVTDRISANMGNSIFVAAYLVMVVPITVVRILTSLKGFFKKTDRLPSFFLVTVVYTLILCMQLAAIFFSGSRGPWIGLAASLVAVWFGLAFIWRKPAIYISGLVILTVSVIFLGLINIKGGPLEPLRNMPGIGRLGQLLNSESRTGKVRSLIWQGASQLVLPHNPLSYPDGTEDRLNSFRPLIGYGPESMFVAYNRFYPPALTEVEKRNAAPDRSHNEVWDSLVFTGVIGMTATLVLFGVIIQFCLKNIGFITDRKELVTFLFCSIGGGIIFTGILVIWKGPGYFGVGLPLGLVSGVILFMLLSGYRGNQTGFSSFHDSQYHLLYLGLLSAILAHSVELIFGFGITATRMYFWIFTGLILVLGENINKQKVEALASAGTSALQDNLSHPDLSPREKNARPKERGSAGKRKKPQPMTRKDGHGTLGSRGLRDGVLSGFLLALILTTISFDFISTDAASKNLYSIIRNSFLNAGSSGNNTSFAVIFLMCWVLIGLVLILEIVKSENDSSSTLYMALIIYVTSLLVAFIFITWLAGNLSAIILNPSSDSHTSPKASEGI